MILGNKIGIQHSSDSLSSYWRTRKPSGLTANNINGGVRLDWVDNSSGAVETEVWGRSNSGESALLYTIAAGTVTKNDLIDPVAIRYYKIRGKKGTNYSDFTSEVSLAMIRQELVNQSTWNDVGLDFWQSKNNNWTGDGTYIISDNSVIGGSFGTNSLMLKKGRYWITIKLKDIISGSVTVKNETFNSLVVSDENIHSFLWTVETVQVSSGKGDFAIQSNNFQGKIEQLSIQELCMEEHQFNKGKLILTLDDDATSLLSHAYPTLAARGILPTHYVITGQVGSSGSNLTWDNLATLRAAGWDLQCHTHDHVNLTSRTKEQILAQYQAVNDAFVAHGMSIPQHTSYPYGAANPLVQNTTAQMRLTGRTTSATYVRKETDMWSLGVFGIGGDGTHQIVDDFKGWVDSAILYREAAITLCHGVSVDGEGTSTQESYFIEMMDYAISSGIDIITIPDLFALMNFWGHKFVSVVTPVTTGLTTQTITANVIGNGFDGLSFEYSLNGTTGWTVEGTTVLDKDNPGSVVYNAINLSPNTYYYWRARPYKGTEYGDYSLVSTGIKTWEYFKMTVDTTKAGSAADTFVLPTHGLGYNAYVDWGEGGAEQNVSGTPGNVSHTYAAPGTYQIKIYGTFPEIYFNNGGDRLKVMSIDSWGAIQWRSLSVAFLGCANMQGLYLDSPDLSICTSLANTFQGCTLFNGGVANWDVSHVLTMSSTFRASGFNQPLTGWDTSNCTDFSYMFMQAASFKQSLAGFNIAKATTVYAMLNSIDINAIGTSTNYDATLASWAAQAVASNLSLTAQTSKYGDTGLTARNYLTGTKGWTITDGGHI